MNLILTVLALILGFILLVKGADFFVEGSSSVARLLKIPTIIIGLTIVAFGTSAPEAAVSITAGLNGNNDIAISNVIGSNMFNLLMVIGVCAVIAPIDVDKNLLKKEFPFSILLTILLLGMCLDHITGFSSKNTISRLDAIILLIILTCFVLYMIYSALRHQVDIQEEIKTLSPVKSILFIIGGIAGIIWGGDMVVDNASIIAGAFGLSDTLIGLTVVAFGTSLPELATSVVAAKKGESDLALGNVVGSNIFNILFVLGASGVASPISVGILSIYDLLFLLVANVVIFVFSKTKYRVARSQGLICVILYLAYTVYIIIR